MCAKRGRKARDNSSNNDVIERLSTLFCASLSAEDTREEMADMLCGELVYYVSRRRWTDAGHVCHIMNQLSLWKQ